MFSTNQECFAYIIFGWVQMKRTTKPYLVWNMPGGLVAPADVDEGERGGSEDGVPTTRNLVLILSVMRPPRHGLHPLPQYVAGGGNGSIEHVEGQL